MNDSFDQPRRRRNQLKKGWDAEDQSFNKLIPRSKQYDSSINFGSYEVQFKIYTDKSNWSPKEQLSGWISHLRSRPGLKPGFPNHEPCPNQVSADQVSNLFWVHYHMSSLDMVWRN